MLRGIIVLQHALQGIGQTRAQTVLGRGYQRFTQTNEKVPIILIMSKVLA